MSGIFSENDKKIIQALVARYREIAESPENALHIKRAYNTNDLGGGRPFVSIEELPWNELNFEGILDCRCEHEFARDMEMFFRRELYRWDYFRVDHIFYPDYYIPKAFDTSDMGISVHQKTLATDIDNPIVSHCYIDILPDEASLEQMHNMVVTPRPDLDAERMEMARELLGGIMNPRLIGMTYNYFAPWDDLVQYHGVENTYIDLIDRPEFMHAMIDKYIDIHLDYLDQLEKYDLLGDFRQAKLHCTASHTTLLPHKEEGEHITTQDMWTRAIAQPFGSCSPEDYHDFEIAHMDRVMQRFGLVYYGCCEPLDHVIPYLKKYPKVRKIGVSPFADIELCAEQIGKDYVLSRKPHPAYVANRFSADVVRGELRQTEDICTKYGCSYDYTLKDISTVDHDPRHIFEWARVITEELDRYYGTDC